MHCDVFVTVLVLFFVLQQGGMALADCCELITGYTMAVKDFADAPEA